MVPTLKAALVIWTSKSRLTKRLSKSPMTTLSQALSDYIKNRIPSWRLVSATKLEKHMTVLCFHTLPNINMAETMDTRSKRPEQQESRLQLLYRLNGSTFPFLRMSSSTRNLSVTQISLPQTVHQLTKRLQGLGMQLHGLLPQKKPVFAPRSL